MPGDRPGGRIDTRYVRCDRDDRVDDLVLCDALISCAVGRAGVTAVGCLVAMRRVAVVTMMAAVRRHFGGRQRAGHDDHRDWPGDNRERQAGGEKLQSNGTSAGRHQSPNFFR